MSEQTESVRVAVDQARCIGSGQCELLEEAVFALDDDTAIASTIGDASLPLDRAQTVIDRCPSGAIAIVAETTSEEEE